MVASRQIPFCRSGTSYVNKTQAEVVSGSIYGSGARVTMRLSGRQAKGETAHFVFLGGLHRSGTSMLNKILMKHPDISGFEDTGAPEDEGQHLQTVYLPARAHGGPGRFAFDRLARLTEQSDLVNSKNRKQLINEWGRYYDFDAPVLIEKSPPNIIRTRFLQALFPNSSFVILVRNPIPVAYSTLRRVNTSIVELLCHWTIAHRILLGDLSRLRRVFLLRYEDFVENPSYWLDCLQAFIGIEHSDIDADVSDLNKKYFFQWDQEDPLVKELALLFDHPGGIVCEFGYSLKPPYVNRLPSHFADYSTDSKYA